EAPVLAAAPDGLAAVPAVAVGLVAQEGAAVELGAVLVARRADRLDVQESEAGAVVDAVGPLDDDDVLDVAGVVLADDGVQVGPGRHPEAAVALGVDQADLVAADARVAHDGVALLNPDAGVRQRPAQQAAGV